MNDLDTQLKKVKDYFIEKLEQHLAKTIPDPHILDIICNIYLPQKNITLEKIYIQPSQSFLSIKDMIINELRKANHMISYFNEVTGYIIILPPEKIGLCQQLLELNQNMDYYKDLDDYISKSKELDLECIKINSPNVIAGYQICPYSTLVYVGDFKLKEEILPECITYDYKLGQVVNYFSCENCNTNWICQACAEYCHKGHTLNVYLNNKKTTWACCYCFKNNLCKALNKNASK